MKYSKQTIFTMIFFFVALLLVCALWLISPIIVKWAVDSEYFTTRNEASVIGDQFGLIGSLFSALAFVAILFALFLQQRQLRLQETELKTQVEVQKLTAVLSSTPGLILDEEFLLVERGYGGPKRPSLSVLRNNETSNSKAIDELTKAIEVDKAKKNEIIPRLETLEARHKEERLKEELLAEHTKLGREKQLLQNKIQSNEKELSKVSSIQESIARLIEFKLEQRHAYETIKGYDIPDSAD